MRPAEENGADVAWQGFHHVALVTADFDATLHFYGDVLGMKVGEIMGRDARGNAARHCFVRPGETRSLGLHVFEAPDARYSPDAATMEEKFGLSKVGQHHMAFALPDEAAGVKFRERLEQHGIRATPFGEAGPVRNMLFLDNNGLLLEATWPKS